MGRERQRYAVVIESLPRGHGFKKHTTTTKKGAQALAKSLRPRYKKVRVKKLSKIFMG